MPPKKGLPEAPVIFSLRLPVNQDLPTPAHQCASASYSDILQTADQNASMNYSDILQSVEQSHVSERFNTEIMKDILNRTRTPTYSGTASCFWCCHPFPWKASVLPISYDAYENMYTCEGHFCCPECALAYLYADPNMSDVLRWNRHALLSDLYRKLYDKKDITPAPNRNVLRMFGGPLDIEQFREYTSCSEDMIAVHLPPLRLYVPSMNVQGPIRDVKKFVALSQETVDKASKELRLKRSAPAQTNVPTLDKIFNL